MTQTMCKLCLRFQICREDPERKQKFSFSSFLYPAATCFQKFGLMITRVQLHLEIIGLLCCSLGTCLLEPPLTVAYQDPSPHSTSLTIFQPCSAAFCSPTRPARSYLRIFVPAAPSVQNSLLESLSHHAGLRTNFTSSHGPSLTLINVAPPATCKTHMCCLVFTGPVSYFISSLALRPIRNIILFVCLIVCDLFSSLKPTSS